MVRRISNPPNRFSGRSLEWFEEPPPAHLEIFEEEAKSIISENDSPDIAFRYSINPYRGCFHGCAYCYARPTHQYIEFNAGTDFERKIVAKVNAPALLEKAFMAPRWQGDTLIFSGVTDCYQPLELQYELTRKCLAVCAKFRNPVAIITKGALVRRDLDLLMELNEKARVSVNVSLAFIDDEMARKLEPHAPSPSTRIRVIRELASHGIPVGIGLAPVIPGLNDTQVAKLLEQAAEAGARSAFLTLLRLPAEVRDVFFERLEEAIPNRRGKVESAVKKTKAGALNRSEFGQRMRGTGERWNAIEWLFEQSCQRLGLNERRNGEVPPEKTFCRPKAQLSLF